MGKIRKEWVEEMELGELDMETIEKKCDKKRNGHVSRRKLELLQEAIFKTKVHQILGIDMDSQKGSKQKNPGRRSKKRKENK